jgi:hypothetical protein
MSECWLGESPYNCPDCDGGEAVCECCGTDCECPECEGTGWNPELVDVPAFKAAAEALNERARAAGSCALSWEWVENGKRLGRNGGEFGRVAVADFLKEKGGK